MVTKDDQVMAMMEQQCDTNKRLMVLVENLAAEVCKLANRTAATVEEPHYQPMQYQAPARGTYPSEQEETEDNSKPRTIETEIPMPVMPEYHPPVVDGPTSGPGEGPG